jgi:hypothetical protein
MAAGQGFKTFTTGEVLTAGDVNGYLMQGINVFTNATARDAAITAPAEGQFAFTKDNNSLWYYDGAAWVASGATGDIEGVTAGVGISGGGTSGTVTVTNSMATALTTKGDIVVATGSGTFVRQAAGADNQVLMAASGEADGVKYANEATATLTTTGDTLYASAANTLARRAIGTTGQVLTVAGGLPTWATPAGSAQSFTQLSSASVGTGTTYTVSGLSGYNQLFFSLQQISCNGPGFITIRFNSDSGSNYDYNGLGLFTNGSSILSQQQANNISNNIINWALPNLAANSASGSLYMQGANSTGVKIFQYLGVINGTNATTYAQNGAYRGTSVISSITIGGDGNNFDAGTLTIWGAA